MKRAGLTISLLRSEAILHTSEAGSDLGWVAKMMLPRITNFGVATEAEMKIDTFEDRLKMDTLLNRGGRHRHLVSILCLDML